MSSTATIKGTAQQAAEQRFAESSVKNLEQRATAPTTADPQGSDSAVINLTQAATATTAVQTQIIEKIATNARDLTSFGQGSVEAMTQASRILATGSQDLFNQMVASMQAAYAEALSGFAALVSAKTVRERIELQSNLMRTSATRAIAECSRFTKAGFDLGEKASSPLIARATAAAEIFPSFKG